MIFHRSRGPQARQKSVPKERAASPTRLFKGVWGRCHQQADWTSRPRREVQFCIVGPTMPCLPVSLAPFTPPANSSFPSNRQQAKKRKVDTFGVVRYNETTKIQMNFM